MADIRISELPLATGPTAPAPSDVVALDGETTRKSTLSGVADAIRPVASQAEAEAGVNSVKTMTPLTTAQAIIAQVSVAGVSGNYNDLVGRPTLGSAAAQDVGAFATALQGAKADTALQVVTDADLAAPANITYLNQSETTLSFYGGDIVEMFNVSTARQFSIGAASIEFDEPFEIPASAKLSVQDGAIFRPTFDLTTTLSRATPYIRVNAGSQIDRIDVRLVAGINTVRKLVEINGRSKIGYANAESVDPNNNRVSAGGLDAPYIDNGAFVFKGDGILIGHLRHDHFDRGMACIGATNLWIGYRQSLRHIMAAYYEESENIYIMGGVGTGMNEADAATCSGRGRMTPGANLNCFAGARNVHIYGERSYGALEHGNRVGLASGTIKNEGVWYHGCSVEMSYGCGFKQDDGDANLIRDVHYIQPVTIDIGAGVWGEPNDGNKQAIAVRNSQRTVIEGHINRAINQTNSGYFGEWFERFADAVTIAPDIEGAVDAGIMIANNGTDIESLQIRGGRLNANGRGLAYVPGSNHVARGINITGLKSSGNTGLDVDFQARPDAASPFVSTEKSRIEADAPSVSIAGAVYADGDFSSNIFIGKARALYDPPSLTNGSGVTTTISVTGSALGDRVTVAFGDTQGITIYGWVSASGTVSVRFVNNTGGTIDLAQSALIVQVYR